jgi:hypothetical protein
MEHDLVEMRKGMYGLSAAVIIANERLVHPLAEFGIPQHTPDLFAHATSHSF